MSLIKADKGRGKTLYLTIKDASGDVVTPGANDKLRVVIGREGKLGTAFADAEFYVDTDADTANGSSITKNSPNNGKNTLRLDASDLDFAAGIYTLFFDYYDNADAAEWKTVDRQVFCLEDT